MSRRMMIALFLSLLVVMVFQFLQGPQKPAESPGNQEKIAQSDTTTETVQKQTKTADEKAEPANSGSDANAEPGQEPDRAQVEPLKTDTAPEVDTVPFNVAGLKGHFTTAGARLDSIYTKEYKRIGGNGGLYNLVHRNGQGLQFEMSYPNLRLNDHVYKHVKTSDTRTYVFKTQLENGLLIKKRYQLSDPRKYRASLDVTIKNTAQSSLELNKIDLPTGDPSRMGTSIRWGPGFGVGREEKTQFDRVYWYYGKNGEMNYFSPQGTGGIYGMIPFLGSENGDKPYDFESGPVEWSAVSNRYFIAAVVPEKPFDGLFLKKGDESDSFVTWANYEPVQLSGGESREYNFELFLGPKFYSSLQKFQPGLESTLNYGWFTLLTYPLLIGMRWIYAVIPNYGVAIILLSIVIKFLLYPLTKKGLVSMRKMKELQPKMKEIQEKYSDDREKMNEKLMEFYQEHNVNPLGGCLPMLLQLPIFIALYRMLEYSIELRGAPFALWIVDLSAKDPYYILPVLMGILMFFQQWYTMASSTGGAMGQQQQMMMYVMPVFMTFIFMNFPVGLVLYWMTNSATTLVQYWMINQSMEESAE